MARKHETLYRRFKANEAAQFITGPYRRLHPLDNNERQAIHEHRSAEPQPPSGRERRESGYRSARNLSAPIQAPTAPAAPAAAPTHGGVR
jgi:hypothetical protein